VKDVVRISFWQLNLASIRTPAPLSKAPQKPNPFEISDIRAYANHVVIFPLASIQSMRFLSLC
jgi:hypothetical protein